MGLSTLHRQFKVSSTANASKGNLAAGGLTSIGQSVFGRAGHTWPPLSRLWGINGQREGKRSMESAESHGILGV